NRYVADYEADPSKIKRFPEQLAISSARQVMAYWNPEADPDRTCMPAGQGVGSFHDIRPAGEILQEIATQAEAILRRGVVAPASGARPRIPAPAIARLEPLARAPSSRSVCDRTPAPDASHDQRRSTTFGWAVGPTTCRSGPA